MEPLPSDAESDQRFANRFRAVFGGAGPVTFAAFMDLALYDREVGYYMAARERVGREAGTDFITAASMDAVFGTLVAEAAKQALGADAQDHVFVEIGAEPDRSVLAGVEHPFSDVITLRRGDPLNIPARAVVFSNELFDAQPFHRIHWRDGAWREIGVVLEETGAPAFHDLPGLCAEVAAIADRLPGDAAESYTIDLPLAAIRLMEAICRPDWSGVLIAFDYGRPWDYLAHAAPEGTARAYHRHKQSNDLLAHPGRQDLTCHVCWDWLEEVLRATGFQQIRRESQEAYFLHRASGAIHRVIRESPDPLSRPRTQLKELLHPGMFGQKFEVLSAIRTAEAASQARRPLSQKNSLPRGNPEH